ncbi:MAG: heme NO-binding domain-containing protein, partial [Halarcobacter sp.]
MRGVIFTEMIEFVEEALGYEVADKMIEKAHLDNGGAFSQGGNYPFDQMVKMLTALSEITGKPPHELLFI